jgi:hypothetical protein
MESGLNEVIGVLRGQDQCVKNDLTIGMERVSKRDQLLTKKVML